jgi:SAM-dependent methyltransferase
MAAAGVDPHAAKIAAAAAAAGTGRMVEAVALYAEILETVPHHPAALAGLAPILEIARSGAYHPGLAVLTSHCLAAPGVNPEALSPAATHQLAHRFPQPAADIAGFAADPLALRVLENAVVRDVAYEAALCRLRGALVAGPPTPDTFRLAVAFAHQAYNNEYIWDESPSETAAAAALAPDAFGLACRAMYAPLDDAAEAMPELAALWQRTRAEPARVRERAAAVAPLFPIEDATSQAVRAMYEINPYPRWLGLTRFEPIDARAQVALRYPSGGVKPRPPGPLDVLIAGCGTGRHALSVATTYRDARVLAVDLSRASLGYGARMAEIEGVTNVEFRHGDILTLPRLGRSFPHVESVGVIHHMRSPREGLEALVECLAPYGLLRLGLYGEAARAGIVAARAAIAERAYPADLAGMRRFRADVVAGALGAALRDDLVARPDFHSASLLRDLCFHVQEHRFDCARLKALLDGLPLRFLGFEFVLGQTGQSTADAPQFRRYAERFPGNRSFADLARWAELERETPDLFDGYVFWCMRI